jgi:hypothetical protein
MLIMQNAAQSVALLHTHIITDTFSDLNASSVIKNNHTVLVLGDTVHCTPLY